MVDFEKALEMVPRHTYMYGQRTNSQFHSVADLVEMSDKEVRKLQADYGLVRPHSSSFI